MVNDLADLYVGYKEWSLNQGTYISNNINWKHNIFCPEWQTCMYGTETGL